MSEEIGKEIEELKLVVEAKENEKRLAAHREERLSLLKHPFVMRVRDVMLENGYMHIAKLRKQLHEKLDVQKQEVLNDLSTRVTAELKAQSQPQVTRSMLTKTMQELIDENRKKGKGMVV